jgi:hypothetical protein
MVADLQSGEVGAARKSTGSPSIPLAEAEQLVQGEERPAPPAGYPQILLANL